MGDAETGMLRVKAGPATCHWGFLEAALPPVARVSPGERVHVETLSGGPENLPERVHDIPDSLRRIHALSERLLPGHILTGPIAVEGAEPGDMLEVKILKIDLASPWGYIFHRPLGGALPGAFSEPVQRIIDIDRPSGRVRTPWGLTLDANPFFGVIATAPPPQWGRCSSIIPRAFGGNLDNKELVAGTSLFLPVFVDGANLSVGDGHAVQADGEVCGTAVETALTGEFEMIVHKGAAPERPHALTPTHLVTMAMGPDLDRCAELALGDMIDRVVIARGCTRSDAYMTCSLCADLRITQVVNQHKGVHCMISREVLG